MSCRAHKKMSLPHLSCNSPKRNTQTRCFIIRPNHSIHKVNSNPSIYNFTIFHYNYPMRTAFFCVLVPIIPSIFFWGFDSLQNCQADCLCVASLRLQIIFLLCHNITPTTISLHLLLCTQQEVSASKTEQNHPFSLSPRFLSRSEASRKWKRIEERKRMQAALSLACFLQHDDHHQLYTFWSINMIYMYVDILEQFSSVPNFSY